MTTDDSDDAGGTDGTDGTGAIDPTAELEPVGLDPAGDAGPGGRAPGLTVDFCGLQYVPDPDQPFFLGREGDIVLDENPYLHRRFLMITRGDGLWWLTNLGSLLAATVADESGHLQAYLAPGGRLPLVFPKTIVWFTAGPTTYEFEVLVADAGFTPVTVGVPSGTGTTTIGQVSFTPSQRLLILALAEPLLRSGRGTSSMPTSAQAAERLGWPLTTFNRKLDNVCAKLTQAGVRGLHGGPDRLAVNRRARLVEYAAAARVVTADLLPLLDRNPRSSSVAPRPPARPAGA